MMLTQEKMKPSSVAGFKRDGHQAKLDARRDKVLEYLRAGFNTGEIVEEMDDHSIATVQRDVRHLIADGLITKREIPRKTRGFNPTEETRILIAMMLRKGAKAREIGEAVGYSAQTQ